MVHLPQEGIGPRPVAAFAVDVSAVALRTKRMELVISTEAERPASVAGRPGAIARVAAEPAFVGAGVLGEPV